MKKRLAIFFLIHLFIVFTLAICVTVNSFYLVNYHREPRIPVLGYLKENVYENRYFMNYLIFSGINTGYGFYGLNTSTEKMFTIELYDTGKKLILEDAFFNFKTMSGFSRFRGFASSMANHISDTQGIKDRDKNGAGKELIRTRELYVEKIFKWLGKKIAGNVPSCAYYKIKLNTIVPVDIWQKPGNKETPDIYVIKEMDFPAR